MIENTQIAQSKHIVLITNNETFALSNALYSYILTLHKKVSLISEEKIEKKFAFLPWFDKVRKQIPSSKDLSLEPRLETLELYKELQTLGIKINAKIATSLYSSLLIEHQENDILCDSEKLTAMGELITAGADAQTAKEFLLYSNSLARFRLKAMIFAGFVLKDEARVAEAYIDDMMLKSSGADLEDAINISRELLEIAHVQKVVLVKQDEEKILYTIKEED
ncbi:MAG: hypothetical protein ABXS93_02905 [Sulfurimonas sp.]